MSNRIPSWAYGCLALLSFFIVGAGLGVLLFAYGGEHFVTVSSIAREISYVVGLTFALIGVYCIIAFTRFTRSTHRPSLPDPGRTDPPKLIARPWMKP